MYKRLEKTEYLDDIWIEDGDSIQYVIDLLSSYDITGYIHINEYYSIQLSLYKKRLETEKEYNRRIDGLIKEKKKDKENKKKLREKLIKDLEKEGYLVTKKNK